MTKAQGQLMVPMAAGVGIAAEVRRYGELDVETGGFFAVAESDMARVTIVAFAGERGIERRRGMFHVSGKAMDRLFAWADQQGLRIPAQFHSHGGEAFLSKTDRRDGFNVTEFISGVVPEYLNPPTELAAWGWWIFDGNNWIPIGPPEIVDGAVTFVVFDEDGVRDRG